MEVVADELAVFNTLVSQIITFLVVALVIGLVFWQRSIVWYSVGAPLCIVYGLSLATPGAELSMWVVGVAIALIGTSFMYQIIMIAYGWVRSK